MEQYGEDLRNSTNLRILKIKVTQQIQDIREKESESVVS